MRYRNRIIRYGFLLPVIAGLVAVAGCSSSPSTSSTPPPSSTTPPTSGVSFSKDIQPIFNNNCVICHQGSPGPGGLSLASGAAYANLVNVKSSESALNRVSPGAPQSSYLVNKIMGTQNQAGGNGGQMPLGGSPLSPAQISLIQQWITQGAPNN
jgi:hypothetical protein